MLTEEQKKLRLQGITGSEVAALVNKHPFLKPIDVYANKNEGRQVERTSIMEQGDFLEDGAARWYAYRTNSTLREVGTLQHPKNKIIIATPDRLALNSSGEIDLSIKIPTQYSKGWGEPGTDEVPMYAYLQLQWELIILDEFYGITRADLAAPRNGELAIYHIDAEPDTQQGLIETAARFYHDHILPKRPPEPDDSKSYGKWLETRYPSEPKEIGPLPDVLPWLEQLRQAKAEVEAWEAKEREARNRITEMMTGLGVCVIRDPSCSISYKLSKGRASTDWDAVCAEAYVPRELIEKHTQRKPYPVFRATFKDDK